MQDKLNALLGIQPEVVEKVKQKVAAKKGNIIGVTEDEIDERRDMEGLVYFLQAPELFHPRVCKKCEEPFLVSRLHVAYCSYQCIRNNMRDQWGIEWRNGGVVDEVVIRDIYEGNEPLWVRNLSTLQKALTKLTQTLDNSEELESLPASLSPVVASTPSVSPAIPAMKIPIPKLH